MLRESDKKKKEILGEYAASATRKLTRMILFDQAKRLGDAVCFKCGKDIEAAEDLSIEHKTPWLSSGKESFWDLDNIAFSHKKCNRPHKWDGKHRYERGEDEAWCSRCQTYKSKDAFNKNSKRWNGLQAYCRSCIKDRESSRLSENS